MLKCYSLGIKIYSKNGNWFVIIYEMSKFYFKHSEFGELTTELLLKSQYYFLSSTLLFDLSTVISIKKKFDSQ